VQHLSPGAPIKIAGRINFVSSLMLTLRDCEAVIDDARGAK
jgi:hypothetical protein